MDLTQYIFECDRYQAIPLNGLGNAEAIQAKYSYILDRAAAHSSFFTDYIKGCDGECEGSCTNASPNCIFAREAVKRAIFGLDAMVWEVWKKEEVDLVGILRLSDIVVGCDATAHYFFFDGRLKDKTELLQRWAEWVASDHAGWPAIHRISIKVPEHAFALARHAKRHLQFVEEGVKREAILFQGKWWDEIHLGRLM